MSMPRVLDTKLPILMQKQSAKKHLRLSHCWICRLFLWFGQYDTVQYTYTGILEVPCQNRKVQFIKDKADITIHVKFY